MAKKKNMRNEFEFMASVLDALGVEYEEADIKVRERWRGKVLEGWGVEYIPDDVKQFERWRGKCIEGLSKSGSGNSWKLLYNGTVTTVADEEDAMVTIEGYYTDADKIKVTFDGVEYIIPKTIFYSKPAYGDFRGEIISFENYPFAIYFRKGSNSNPDEMTILTPEAGTHVIKIETPTSGGGGSSDFSTAKVEFKNQTNTNLTIRCCCIVDNNIESTVILGGTQSKTCTAVLYKGSQQVEIPFGAELTTVTGDITVDGEEGIITINGSGTVLFQP